MIKELTKLATHLDAKGLRKEADYLDAVIRKMADKANLNPERTPPPTPKPDANKPWVFNPENSLGRAILDCSGRKAEGGITCFGWKDLEKRAREQRPDLTIPSCGTGWTPEAGFGNCHSEKLT
jgi:hypothetical protein